MQWPTISSPFVSSTPSPDQMPGYYSYERTETFVVTNIRLVLLYVNSNEKWTGMKNTGLQMPEKDQIYV